MNCFSRSFVAACLLLCSACGAPASETPAGESSYAVHYTIKPDPAAARVHVTMQVRQPRLLLREIHFDDHMGRVEAIDHGEDVRSENGRIYWQPGVTGGEISWHVDIRHKRNSGGHDAWLDLSWGIFRAEDIIPPASTRTLKGARSETSFSFDLPAKWSVVTEYSMPDGRATLQNPDRRFDQPHGWIALGKLGVRRETIAATRVTVAGPQGHDVRRMDMLALLNWTLPEINKLFPQRLPRLTIFSASEPMWRGGLSAPASLFIHADRPMISENATSTLLHETMHVVLGLRAQAGDDWIVEGLAEYYSIELLRKGGAITQKRFREALNWQTAWGTEADTLCGQTSSGARTALAVTILAALDNEIRAAGNKDLSDVVRQLLALEKNISLADLLDITSELLGARPDALHSDQLRGCSTITAANN